MSFKQQKYFFHIMYMLILQNGNFLKVKMIVFDEF